MSTSEQASTARSPRKPDTVMLELTVIEGEFLRTHCALSGEISDDAEAFKYGDAADFDLDALLAKINATASDAKPTLTLGDLRKFSAAHNGGGDWFRGDQGPVIHAYYSDGEVHITTSSDQISLDVALRLLRDAPADAPVFVDGEAARSISDDEKYDETVSISTKERETE